MKKEQNNVFFFPNIKGKQKRTIKYTSFTNSLKRETSLSSGSLTEYEKQEQNKREC